MKRRTFIKRGALFVPTIFLPRLLRANSLPVQNQAAFFAPKTTPPSGGGGGFTYTLISHAAPATVDATGTATTAAIDTTGANLIVINVAWFSGTLTITDSKANSAPAGLTVQSDSVSSPIRFNRIYYLVPNPAKVGSGHTFSVASTSAGYCVISVAAFAKSSGTPTFDTENGFTDTTGTGLTIVQPGSVTPAGNNELIVTGMTWNKTAPTVTLNQSFLSPPDSGSCPTTDVISGGMSWLIQTTGGAVNPTWTFSLSVSSKSATIAAFK